jgi:hypothetical protein
MATFGITKIAGTLVESVDVTLTGETKELINADGTHSAARIVDTQFSFSVKGKGDLPPTLVLGGNVGEPTDVTGKVIVTKITESQTNEDWIGWSYDGVAYTAAT